MFANRHTVHKFSHWLTPVECICSRMRSKVQYEWIPICIKAGQSVPGTLKMAAYFPDRPIYRINLSQSQNSGESLTCIVYVRSTFKYRRFACLENQHSKVQLLCEHQIQPLFPSSDILFNISSNAQFSNKANLIIFYTEQKNYFNQILFAITKY